MTVDFDLLKLQLEALISVEPDPLANTANFVALLHDALSDVNWTGIYLLRGSDLLLGPFQGKPACTRIPLGRGVCGTAAAQQETQRIADVHAFEGHIACDPESRSELVVPLFAGERIVGVLDIDSPSESRFSINDESGIEGMCRVFEQQLGETNLLALVR